MKAALILTTYQRPAELKRCLESLSKATPPDVLIIVDDRSTDEEARQLMHRFSWGCRTIIELKSKNRGIKDSLIRGFDMAFNHLNCNIAINLDPDAVVKPDFIKRMTDLYDGKHIVSGFNCNHPKNPVLSEHDGYVMRKHANGICMMVDKNQYETILKPALQDKTGNWDYNSTNQHPFKICVPSCCQHIGQHNSTMGHGPVGDVACDFKLLNLPTVTLLGVDANDPAGINKSAEICQREIDFGAVKIITERLFYGREGYSEFCIKEMQKYVNTDHVLIIHADSWILNPAAWDDKWLDFDYLGAVWEWLPKHQVGNGGFSLRSKKFLKAIAELPIKIYHPEDAILCQTWRNVLEKDYGIKFAPIEVCRKFSIEAFGNPNPKYSGQFGFHGGDIDFSSLTDAERPYQPKKKGKVVYPALTAWNQRQKPIGRRR